jgi:peptide methionine sulfoxide reductase MsrB
MGYEVEKTEAEWRAQLTPEECHVLREAGTERPFTGEYTDTETMGVYSAGHAGLSCSAPTTSSTAAVAVAVMSISHTYSHG